MQQSGHYFLDGRAPQNRTAGQANITIHYDAASQSYTVDALGMVQTFGPGDLDAASSDANFAIYKSPTNSSEFLTLTRPGTSGPLNFSYVGGGYWQRGLATADGGFDFGISSFVYGVQTPAADVPRTGSAAFAVALVGGLGDTVPVQLSGAGRLMADFATGGIYTTGTMDFTRLDTGAGLGSTSFSGSGTIGSGTDSFSGLFAFNWSGMFSGTMNGHFYGPNADEVGVAWYAAQDDGRVAAGTLLGRQNDAAGIDTRLSDLRYDLTQSAQVTDFAYAADASGAVTGTTPATSYNRDFAYESSDGSYTYTDAAGIARTMHAADRDAAQSSASLDVYQITNPDGSRYRLSLFRPGPGNPQLALTYTSFGRWDSIPAGALASDPVRNSAFFAWGIKTDPNLLPRTGTGHYEGVVAGIAASTGGAAYELGGTSLFDVDFGSLSFGGGLTLNGRDVKSGVTSSFGTFAFAPGTVGLDGALAADLWDGANSLGSFRGQLYGPGAQELGGSFNLRWPNDPANPTGPATEASGVTVAKRP